jgi:hypothetical protein
LSHEGKIFDVRLINKKWTVTLIPCPLLSA